MSRRLLRLVQAIVPVLVTAPQIASAQAIRPAFNPAPVDPLLHRVVIFDADDRRTEAQYAKQHGVKLDEIKKTFAATGVIRCGNTRGTAQVTVKRDIVTTAGHILYDLKTCKLRVPVTQCTFSTQVDGRSVERRFKTLLGTGMDDRCRDRVAIYDDWAVLKLDREIAVEPYQLSSSTIRNNDLVTQASAIAQDFYFTSNSGRRDNPRHFGDCQVKSVRYTAMPWYGGYTAAPPPVLTPQYLVTDCDADHGSSGSALLRKTDKGLAIVGITARMATVSSSPAALKRAYAGKVAAPVKGTYDFQKWSNFHVGVGGAFLAAIRKATEPEVPAVAKVEPDASTPALIKTLSVGSDGKEKPAVQPAPIKGMLPVVKGPAWPVPGPTPLDKAVAGSAAQEQKQESAKPEQTASATAELPPKAAIETNPVWPPAGTQSPDKAEAGPQTVPPVLGSRPPQAASTTVQAAETSATKTEPDAATSKPDVELPATAE